MKQKRKEKKMHKTKMDPQWNKEIEKGGGVALWTAGEHFYTSPAFCSFEQLPALP